MSMIDLDAVFRLADRQEAFFALWKEIERRAGLSPSRWSGADRTFLLCCWVVNEMDNGGLLQWYMNSRPRKRREMIQSLWTVGAQKTAQLLEEGSKTIRSLVPLRLRVAGNIFYERAAKLVPDSIDNEYYQQDFRGEIYEALLSYVKANPERYR